MGGRKGVEAWWGHGSKKHEGGRRSLVKPCRNDLCGIADAGCMHPYFTEHTIYIYIYSVQDHRRKLASIVSLPEGIAEVFLHCIPCPCCSTSRRSRITRQAGVPKEGSRRRWWGRKSVATTRLHRHDDDSSFSRILTVRNDLSFAEGIYFFIGDNISRRDATRRPSNAQSWCMDRRWLFRMPPIHQGGGATMTAHDFKREPICQL
jgi:hypothetical protein